MNSPIGAGSAYCSDRLSQHPGNSNQDGLDGIPCPLLSRSSKNIKGYRSMIRKHTRLLTHTSITRQLPCPTSVGNPSYGEPGYCPTDRSHVHLGQKHGTMCHLIKEHLIHPNSGHVTALSSGHLPPLFPMRTFETLNEINKCPMPLDGDKSYPAITFAHSH